MQIFRKILFFSFSFSGQTQSGKIYEAMRVIREVDASLRVSVLDLHYETMKGYMGLSWQEPR